MANAHNHDHDHERAHGARESPRHRLRAFVRSLFATHHHDPVERSDSALETSTRGTRALKISLVALAATATLQLVVVLFSGSVALLGDALHNFADALTALPLWLAFALGRRPPNRRYTYGYGRAEDLAGVFIVAMIALSSVVAGWEAVRRLLSPQPVRHLPWVIVAAVIGFLGNELVALYRIRVGRDIGSAALVADGLHARTDGLTSLAVLVGAIGVAAGFQRADPIVGLVITGAILFVLKSAARDIYHRLMDVVAPELVDQVETVLAAAPSVVAVDEVRIRWIGHQLRAEAQIQVACQLPLEEAHSIAEEAHHELLHQIPRLSAAVIHVNPCPHDDRGYHDRVAHHFGEEQVSTRYGGAQR